MDNQYSYYNPNETEGNTSNGTAFYNNGQGDDGKTPKKKKEHKKMPKAVAVTGLALMFGVVSSATFLTTNYVGTKSTETWNNSEKYQYYIDQCSYQ